MHTHTPRDTHTYILWQHAYSERVASCLRSLREQNTTCPLIFPSRAKRDSLSNWSHLLLLSHPMLNGSLSAIFSPTVYPCLCCSFLSLLLRVWSQSTRFCAIILNHIKAFFVVVDQFKCCTWRWNLMRFRFRCATTCFCCCCQIGIRPWGQWQRLCVIGGEVNISLSLCLHYLTPSPLSSLRRCFAFG